MRSKYSLKQKRLVVVLAGFVVVIAIIFYFATQNLAKNNSSSLTVNIAALYGSGKATATIGQPARFIIPKLKIDASFQSVGLTAQGAVDVPKGPSDVAWFNLGPLPGEIGNSIVVGHYGWKNGIAAVFDNLHKLVKGDKIYVKDDKGVTITFVVRDSQRYKLNADVSRVFNSKDGKSHLNLITCEGTWDEASKSYSKRLVVFADKQ